MVRSLVQADELIHYEHARHVGEKCRKDAVRAADENAFTSILPYLSSSLNSSVVMRYPERVKNTVIAIDAENTA